MILSQLGCALIAWGVSSLLKISRPRRGALILASTFTSSAFLGYAVVKEIYQNNPQALSDAAVVSELGVATLLFTFGIFLAMHFGMKLVSFIPLPKENLIIGSIYHALHIIANANTFLVSLTIGVMLHFKDLQHVWLIVLLAIVIKLIIQPLLSYGQATLFQFPPLWHQIVVLEAAMPTAAMTAIFARKYGCDAELTSILIFATFISSCITMFVMVFLLT